MALLRVVAIAERQGGASGESAPANNKEKATKKTIYEGRVRRASAEGESGGRVRRASAECQ